MVTFNLTPGEHIVEMELAGYAPFKGVINVSSTGTVFCVSVDGGSCGATGKPGMSISVNVVTAIMKTISVEICDWVSGVDGWDKLAAYDIMTLVKSYVGQEDIGFSVTSAYIMGAVAYYSGNKSSGNQLTGCGF
jgi:hypothetical protein